MLMAKDWALAFMVAVSVGGCVKTPENPQTRGGKYGVDCSHAGFGGWKGPADKVILGEHRTSWRDLDGRWHTATSLCVVHGIDPGDLPTTDGTSADPHQEDGER